MAFVFANNKGGSGKTTTSVLFAHTLASNFPDKKVVYVDCSLYADGSSIIRGGVERGYAADRSPPGGDGDSSVADSSCSLLRLVGSAKQFAAKREAQGSWRPNTQWRLLSAAAGTERVSGVFDPVPHLVNVKEDDGHDSLPSNLFVLAGGVGIADRDISDGWECAAKAMVGWRDSQSGKGYVLVIDTDHDLTTPYAKFALCLGKTLVVPTSPDPGDVERMFAPVHGLFAVLDMLAQHNFPIPSKSKYIMNRIRPVKYTPGDPQTPFEVGKADTDELRSRTERIHKYLFSPSSGDGGDVTIDTFFTDDVVLIPALPPAVLTLVKTTGVMFRHAAEVTKTRNAHDACVAVLLKL